MRAETTYTIGELAEEANVTTRTIRYYVAQGLLPPPDSSGRAASYNDEHLERLELIRLLKEEFLPLGEIKSLLKDLDGETVRDLLTQRRPEQPKPEPETAKEYLRALLKPSKSPVLMRQVVAAEAESVSSSAAPSQPPHAGTRSSLLAVRAPVARERERPAEETEPTHRNATVWQRYPLHPDIELHVRRPLTDGTLSTRLDQLVAEIHRIVAELCS
jgi:DNA-binding transcriptional MerR regulator